MLLKYVGNKKKLTLGRPFGKETKRCKDKVEFSPGDIKEFSEEEGKLLLELDAEIVPGNEITVKQLEAGAKKQKNGSYICQRSFNLVEDQSEEEHEEEIQEEAEEENVPVLKKRGRPKK